MPATVTPPSWAIMDLKKVVAYSAGPASTSLYGPQHTRDKVNDELRRNPIEVQVPGFGTRRVNVAASGSGNSPYEKEGESSWDFVVELRGKRESRWVPLTGAKLYIRWEQSPGDSSGYLMVTGTAKGGLADAMKKLRTWHQLTYGARPGPAKKTTKLEKALLGYLHNERGTKPAFHSPRSLTRHVEQALKSNETEQREALRGILHHNNASKRKLPKSLIREVEQALGPQTKRLFARRAAAAKIVEHSAAQHGALETAAREAGMNGETQAAALKLARKAARIDKFARAGFAGSRGAAVKAYKEGKSERTRQLKAMKAEKKTATIAKAIETAKASQLVTKKPKKPKLQRNGRQVPMFSSQVLGATASRSAASARETLRLPFAGALEPPPVAAARKAQEKQERAQVEASKRLAARSKGAAKKAAARDVKKAAKERTAFYAEEAKKLAAVELIGEVIGKRGGNVDDADAVYRRRHGAFAAAGDHAALMRGWDRGHAEHEARRKAKSKSKSRNGDEGRIRITYGIIVNTALDRDGNSLGWLPVYRVNDGRQVGDTWSERSRYDKDVALRMAKQEAEAEGARFVGDWDVTVEPFPTKKKAKPVRSPEKDAARRLARAKAWLKKSKFIQKGDEYRKGNARARIVDGEVRLYDSGLGWIPIYPTSRATAQAKQLLRDATKWPPRGVRHASPSGSETASWTVHDESGDMLGHIFKRSGQKWRYQRLLKDPSEPLFASRQAALDALTSGHWMRHPGGST